MGTKYRKVLTNSVLIFLSVTLVVGGLEAALWADLFSSTSSPTRQTLENHTERVITCRGETINTSSDRMQFHPTYGWTGNPKSQYLIEQEGKLRRYTYNADGFRDTYDSGEKNVIVLGDSFTEGALANDSNTYPHLLDRWTPRHAIHNFGLAGYGTDQELVVYRNVSSRYDHDLVIVGYFKNDPWDNVGNKPQRPTFRVQNGEVVNVQAPRDPTGDENETNTTTVTTKTTSTATKTNTTDGDNRDKGTATSTPRAETTPDEDGNSGSSLSPGQAIDGVQSFLSKNTRLYDFVAVKTYNVMGEVGLVPERNDRRIRLTRYLLQEINTEAKENGASVLLVRIPPKAAVNSTAKGWTSPDQQAMLRTVAHNHENVHLLDLEGPLREQLNEGTPVYGETNKHLNERGYRVAARAIYEWLDGNGYVKNSSTPAFSKQYDTGAATCP